MTEPLITRPGDRHQSRAPIWTDPERPLTERVDALLAAMTLEEKLAQLVGVWVGVSADTDAVTPTGDEFSATLPAWDELTRDGLGQLTRVFGTAPLDPEAGARALAQAQRGIVTSSRLGIPAMAHEECLTGFTAWTATVFPTPLAWGASFDPDTVQQMSAGIGQLMRSVGVHQGLSPVLDVTVDGRWGRTEETMGEDPYLVSILGSAYVRGLEGAGVVATVKHFAGYSASRAGRNHGPVSIGPREFNDLILPPFEMAIRDGNARSVMHSYAAVDGVPPAADGRLLTGLLRETYGFRGVVVSDYFGIAYLETTQAIAGDRGAAASLALDAGVDVELPTVSCYGQPLLDRIRSGEVSESLVDRAVVRVLRQKGELGLLDEGWNPEPPALRAAEPIDLDPPHLRELAATLAARSVVLLDNPTAVLPLQSPARLAVVGPCSDDVLALMGCYSFPNHVGVRHPDVPLGIEMASLLDGIRREFPDSVVSHAAGCPVQETDRSGIAVAVDAARAADICIAVLGDRAGLFGRGTSGEGCDAVDLGLPGVQSELLDALLDSGTPVVLVLLTGRPYALGGASDRLAAVVQAFFPGEEGAGAVAGVLSGRINPSGRLPIQVPRSPSGPPSTYLHPILGGPNGASSTDPTPRFPFGHGLSYTTFSYGELRIDEVPVVADSPPPEVPTDGEVTIGCTLRNTGTRAGADVVQLYLHDPVASVTRPIRQLVGFTRVEVGPGESARVTFTVHADRTSFTGRDLERIVEPGELHLEIGASSQDLRLEARIRLTGSTRVVGHDRVLHTPATVHAVPERVSRQLRR